MNYPNFEEEKMLWKQGFDAVVGLDEVGRGPLAGPVVAGAVFIKAGKDFLLEGINDSKKLSEKQREKLYEVLTKHEDIKWGIGIVSQAVIDKINILEATKLAMQKAIEDCMSGKSDGRQFSKTLDYLLIDGNFKINSDVPQKCIIKGDQKVFSISGASIIAKVVRDRLMAEYDKQYPNYGFKKHKGYGTSAHMDMVKKYGACPIHRKSFNPVSRYLSTG